jgi:hypothetical protein
MHSHNPWPIIIIIIIIIISVFLIIKILIAFVVNIYGLISSLVNDNFDLCHWNYYYYSNDINCLIFLFCLCVLFLILYSCLLCNWPLGWKASTHINMNYIELKHCHYHHRYHHHHHHYHHPAVHHFWLSVQWSSADSAGWKVDSR